MPKNVKQFISDDGSIYVFDIDECAWYALLKKDGIPPDIRKKVFEYLDGVEDNKVIAEALKKTL